MKTCVFILASMLIAAITTAQNMELDTVDITPPTFKNHFPNSISAYLQSKVEYPATDIKSRIQGTVVLGFKVTPEGKLKDIKVINSVSWAIDNEVIQALQSTDKMWTPGIVNGQTITMPREVSVVFKLHSKVNFIKLAKKHLQKGNKEFFLNDQPGLALKHFNRGIIYLPNDETLLAVRGLCKYKLGDETGAQHDWDRYKILAKRNGTYIQIENLAELPYDSLKSNEMLHILLKNK